MGAPWENSVATGSGAAYVYERTAGVWVLKATLMATNADMFDSFGVAVAVHGTTVAVGAYGEDSFATGINGDGSSQGNYESGAAYVFEQSGLTWTQTTFFKASNSGGWFGVSLALDANTLVVGAARESGGSVGVDGDDSDESVSFSGAAFVFVRSGATWVQQNYLKASNLSVRGDFGRSLDLDGDCLAVGSPGDRLNVGGIGGTGPGAGPGLHSTNSGAVYLFHRTGATWTQELAVKSDSPHYMQRFGESVAVAPGRLVVGAISEEMSVAAILAASPPASATPGHDRNFGAVYVYDHVGSAWGLTAYIKPSNAGLYDLFGRVALQGDELFVGAPGEASNANGVDGDQADDSFSRAGAVYEFDLDGPDASVTARTFGSNPASLSSSTPILGQTWQAHMDLGLTGHTAAWPLLFAQPTLLGPVGADQWILAGAHFPAGELLGLGPIIGTPNVSISVPIPVFPALSGLELYGQAVLLGGAPFAFTNALDLRLGN